MKQLDDASTSADTRRRLLRILGGGSREIFSIESLPVTGRLAEIAFQYASGATQQDRSAAAGLLAGIDSPESRAALGRLAADADWQVRETAIRSLAVVGDAETLAWLESLAAVTGSNDWEKQRMQAAIDDAKEKLGKKLAK
jgi:HEAT repeat protein